MTPMYQEVLLERSVRDVPLEVSLTNTTTSPMTFRVRIQDFNNLDASGGIAFLGVEDTDEERYRLASWIRLERDTLILLPGMSETVRAVITNDDALAPGGHYGAIIFESVGSLEVHNGIAVQQELASLILAKKLDGAVEAMQLSHHFDARWIFLPRGELVFRSTGNVHVVPRGAVRVTDPLGRPVYKAIINEASTVVLPETERRFPLLFSRDRFAWVPGWYIVEIRHRFDGQEEAQVTRERFFLFPWYSLVVVVVMAGLILVVRYMRQRRHQNNTTA